MRRSWNACLVSIRSSSRLMFPRSYPNGHIRRKDFVRFNPVFIPSDVSTHDQAGAGRSQGFVSIRSSSRLMFPRSCACRGAARRDRVSIRSSSRLMFPRKYVEEVARWAVFVSIRSSSRLMFPIKYLKESDGYYFQSFNPVFIPSDVSTRAKWTVTFASTAVSIRSSSRLMFPPDFVQTSPAGNKSFQSGLHPV